MQAGQGNCLRIKMKFRSYNHNVGQEEVDRISNFIQQHSN